MHKKATKKVISLFTNTDTDTDTDTNINININVNRIELKNLASTLKHLHPDARQCLSCSFGPILKVKCDDLIAHHKQKVSSSSEAIFDNSCPQCGADPPSSWTMVRKQSYFKIKT